MKRSRLLSSAFLAGALTLLTGCATPMESYLLTLEMDANRLATPGKFTVCHGNGCVIRSEVSLAGYHWGRVMGLFDEPAKSPARERKKISQAIAMIETIVGKKIGTHTDVGKNAYKYYDKGQMDCVDETINTSLYLRFLKKGGALAWHVVAGPLRRGFIRPHNTAVVSEIRSGDSYAIDSWFFKNGEEPAIVPVKDWLSGWRPPA